jgi:hypothetical protein
MLGASGISSGPQVGHKPLSLMATNGHSRALDPYRPARTHPLVGRFRHHRPFQVGAVLLVARWSQPSPPSQGRAASRSLREPGHDGHGVEGWQLGEGRGRFRNPQVSASICKRICKPDVARHGETGETKMVRRLVTASVHRGHGVRERDHARRQRRASYGS